jgi:hypothetical protein
MGATGVSWADSTGAEGADGTAGVSDGPSVVAGTAGAEVEQSLHTETTDEVAGLTMVQPKKVSVKLAVFDIYCLNLPPGQLVMVRVVAEEMV